VKPPNQRPALLLPDGAPTRCRFFAWGERGRTEECEQDATALLTDEDRELYREWKQAHPKSIVGVWPGHLHLCDVHEMIVRQCVDEAIALRMEQ
jgi:hypothetical protein